MSKFFTHFHKKPLTYLLTTGIIASLLFLSGCAYHGPYFAEPYEQQSKLTDSATITFSVFLVGDAGDATSHSAVFTQLEKEIAAAGENSAVINLGDNAYPVGLPEEGSPWREKGEEAISAQIEAYSGYPGKVYFIPGNHDWAKGNRQGYSYLMNQEEYLNEAFQKQVFYPRGGCPGPVQVSVNEKVAFVFIDSQWFFQNHFKPLKEDDCGIEDVEDIFVQLRDILRRNSHKSIIVAAHHPLYSIGIHGGHFNPMLNIFPLRQLNKNLWIPLPGFIYTGARKYLGHIQDLAHPRYKQYVSRMEEVLEEFPNVIFTAGHEHNLQYVHTKGIHHIISGSASKVSEIRPVDGADFGISALGYARLDYLSDGSVKLSVKNIDDNGMLNVPFTKELFNIQQLASQEVGMQSNDRTFPDSVTAIASSKYTAGTAKQFLLGENYRKVWQTPVKVEVFDIGKEKGGLKIIKRGGGMQTLSVRLEAKDKRQYTLRSLDKFADKTVPESLKETFAARLVQDNISATFPYGALVAASLEAQLGLYHTNPKIVYIPDDPQLGIYRKELADKLFLFEERPDEDWHEAAFFGNSANIKSTNSAVKDILEDNDLIIDQPFVLKNRLVDMFINDWDRHDDQWRWAPIEREGNTIYRPIPRDRDNAFFVNEGLIPCIAKRQWAVWRLQGLNDPFPDVRGLNVNARHFDRTFLNEMTRDDWISSAKELQTLLTDEVIENALQQLPDSVYRLSVNRLSRLMKLRRKNLVKIAEAYYYVLAKEVDILGSEDDEFFEVTRKPDGATLVEVFDIKGGNSRAVKFYSRMFFPSETEEIRLYGIDDEDVFHIRGAGNKGIKVRIIAGEEEDEISDISNVNGLGKHTVVYDNYTNQGNIITGKETRLKKISSDDEHAYHRKDFEYDMTSPALFFGYNAEDGVFIGGGLETTRHGFRKKPFKERHKLTANYSALTDAFNIRQRSSFTEALGTWDFLLYTDIFGPNYTSNYFGFGNESTLGDFKNNKSYYYMRREQIALHPSFRKRFNQSSLMLGALLETSKIKNVQNRFITDFEENGLSEKVLSRVSYAGFSARYSYNSRNDDLFPTAGIQWDNEASWYLGINRNSGNFNVFKSDLRFFLSRKVNPRSVLALRFGGELVTGSPEIVHAAIVGGETNMRGYPATRFYGDASAYQNTDLRIKLADIHSFYLSGQYGIFGFHDVARVWQNEVQSSQWHNGYGGGVWLSPFGMAMITARYAASKEYNIVRVKFDFHF